MATTPSAASLQDRGHLLVATGIECSYPTVQHGKRRDQLEETQHYARWRDDLHLCRELGARYLRYGPPYYRMHTGPHRYDWSFTDEVLPVMRELGIVPIMDLCHFGVPDWVGGFQNPDWPALFADYADAFAARYPWVRYYTPVNEILVCARFSGKEGIWNEQETSDKAMIMAHANMCRATLLTVERIRARDPDAVFFQSEAAEAFHERWPETHRDVEFLNELRYLTFDFLYGHPPGGDVLMFLQDQGLTKEMYDWFMTHGRAAAPACVMGMDYYAPNEHLLCPDGTQQGVGPVLGWHGVARPYYERYHRPMMLTETNTIGCRGEPDAVGWLWSTWQTVRSLREQGVPVLGFTWYSLADQVDWDIQLREIRGQVNPVGLYTLERTPRPVATAFRELAERYGDLPLLDDVAFAGMPGQETTTSSHPA